MLKKQHELREELKHMEELMVEDRINKLVKVGGIKSDLFWKIRKRILKKSKSDEDYDTITEEGRLLTDPEETKEYISNFYENLYQAREGAAEYKTWTDEIRNEVKSIEKSMETLPDEPEFTTIEVINVIRSLKPGKAPGPDGIPNEAMKTVNGHTLEIFRNEMNKVLESATIREK